MLKRTLAVISALILAGCSASSEKEPDSLAGDLETAVSLTGGYEARLTRTEGSGWDLRFTAPETVKGLEMSLMSDGRCILSLEQHSAVYERSELPQYAPFDLISAAVDMCINGKGIKTSVSDGKTLRTGTVRGVGFTVVSDGGRLLSAELNGGCRAEFGEQPAGSTG